MSTIEIRKILEKYFEGESSLAEERILREYFKQEMLPDDMQHLKAQFLFFDKSSRETIDENEFGANLDKKIDAIPVIRKLGRYSGYVYTVGAAAACIVLYFIVSNIAVNRFDEENTFQDPELAYEETRKTLFFVSETINKGFSDVDKISVLEKGLKELENMSKIQEAENLINILKGSSDENENL